MHGRVLCDPTRLSLAAYRAPLPSSVLLDFFGSGRTAAVPDFPTYIRTYVSFDSVGATAICPVLYTVRWVGPRLDSARADRSRSSHAFFIFVGAIFGSKIRGARGTEMRRKATVRKSGWSTRGVDRDWVASSEPPFASRSLKRCTAPEIAHISPSPPLNTPADGATSWRSKTSIYGGPTANKDKGVACACVDAGRRSGDFAFEVRA
ncbi:hypothetical protein EW146_g6227 [Bondarzewia mesenterica]|uniref:Uncharacterized protein n=1 Tax=Bondarzewia mesenterica TaxID=1095465 RepID=A0A4S4LP63_9AGAM|nr:hypothetical protein EW146_g6227 [Bondarzewia mesenterica]